MTDQADFVIVANRLPVDRVVDDSGETTWRTSPGGLVSALVPVMRASSGAWIGWSGAPDEHLDPFVENGMNLVPVTLSAEEVAEFYEGFSNGTIWPLYHDVIVPPDYHRAWWEAYVEVNQRFAAAAAEHAAESAVVWVQDYQLQLVPRMLRALRPDLTIGYFHHIPFPPYEIYAQLPWRRLVLEGLLGADLLGFQRDADASNFLRATRRALGLSTKGRTVTVPTDAGPRTVRAAAFPISIDTPHHEALARDPAILERAEQIRADVGGRTIVLGVDRLDYTKGIRHRLKAWGELLEEGRIDPEQTVLVTVASPSRERVDQYQALRDEIELQIGRINGDHSSLGHLAVHYLHSSFDREEMSALYRAADVLVVTSLRDGMNLVAKEYVAARTDETGALVLSEFTGAADELGSALRVNPHDIEQVKNTLVRALTMSRTEQARRMRTMRARIRSHDVNRWARTFLHELEGTPDREKP